MPANIGGRYCTGRHLRSAHRCLEVPRESLPKFVLPHDSLARQRIKSRSSGYVPWMCPNSNRAGHPATCLPNWKRKTDFPLTRLPEYIFPLMGLPLPSSDKTILLDPSSSARDIPISSICFQTIWFMGSILLPHTNVYSSLLVSIDYIEERIIILFLLFLSNNWFFSFVG